MKARYVRLTGAVALRDDFLVGIGRDTLVDVAEAVLCTYRLCYERASLHGSGGSACRAGSPWGMLVSGGGGATNITGADAPRLRPFLPKRRGERLLRCQDMSSTHLLPAGPR